MRTAYHRNHLRQITGPSEEELACGLPVVATRVGGIPEVLTDSRVGELVEPDRPVLLAEALAGVVARGPQPEACRRQALPLSWGETVRRYHELLAEVVARAPKGPPPRSLSVHTP